MQFKYAIPLARSWLLQRSILTGRCVSHTSRLQSRFVRLINSAISNAAPCQPHTLNAGACRTFTFTLPISYSESQRWDMSLLHLHTNLILSTSGYVAPSTSHHQPHTPNVGTPLLSRPRGLSSLPAVSLLLHYSLVRLCVFCAPLFRARC